MNDFERIRRMARDNNKIDDRSFIDKLKDAVSIPDHIDENALKTVDNLSAIKKSLLTIEQYITSLIQESNSTIENNIARIIIQETSLPLIWSQKFEINVNCNSFIFYGIEDFASPDQIHLGYSINHDYNNSFSFYINDRHVQRFPLIIGKNYHFAGIIINKITIVCNTATSERVNDIMLITGFNMTFPEIEIPVFATNADGSKGITRGHPASLDTYNHVRCSISNIEPDEFSAQLLTKVTPTIIGNSTLLNASLTHTRWITTISAWGTANWFGYVFNSFAPATQIIRLGGPAYLHDKWDFTPPFLKLNPNTSLSINCNIIGYSTITYFEKDI